MILNKCWTFAQDCVLPSMMSRLPWPTSDAVDLFQAGGMRMVCYRSWPQEPQVLKSWEDLVERCETSTAFQTPHWQFPLLRSCMLLGRMRLIAVFEGERAVAILPLQLNKGHRLESAGASLSDYLDPLVDPECDENAWRAVFWLLRHLPGEREAPVVLHNIRDNSPCRQTLERISADEGYDFEDAMAGTVSRVKLPDTWDEYLASLSGHNRKECRRKLRKAESQANATLIECESAAEAPLHLDHVFARIEAGGGSRGQKCRWIFRRLFRSALRGLMERRAMRLETLQLHGQPAAGIVCFLTKSGPQAWATGYDMEQAAWSPGVVAFAMAIRSAVSRRERIFDFLRGDYRYKYELGAVDQPLHRLTLTPRRAA